MPKTTTDPISRDCQMAYHSPLWPMWPYLPLTHKIKQADDGEKLLGFIVEGAGAVVHVGCLFLVDPATCPKERYGSFEALFEAGWQVD